MKKIIIGTLFLSCISSFYSLEDEIITSPLKLTSDTLRYLSLESFPLYEHVVVVRKFYEKDLETLAKFSNVEVLDLCNAMDIGQIDLLPSMASVQRLNLSTRSVSDLDMEHLATAFKNVKELDLSYTKVLGEELDVLKCLKELTILNLSSTPIYKKELITKLLNESPNLTVYLHDTFINTDDFLNNQKVFFTKHSF